MKLYIISILVFVPFLVFGQTTKPTININKSKTPTTKRSMEKTTTKPSRSTTKRSVKITSKPSGTAATNTAERAPTTGQPSTFTDGSPYIDPTPFMNSITAKDMREHLTILASDEFEGRETGTPGNRMAANYIAQQFGNFNLPRVVDNKSYFQKVSFNKQSWDKLSVMANNETMRNMNDFFAFPSTNSDMPEIKSDEIVFMGYGIDDPNYSDYKGKDVNGKIILVYNGEPKNATGTYYVSKSTATSKWSNNFREKLIMVKLPVDLELTMKKSESALKGDNVLGYIEGVDPKLKDELLVITAHYDHLGKRGDDIYNGADDNGSGTTTVLEIAEAFSKAKKAGVGPRRSVLVMLVTGEEKGLLGSEYYSEFPVFDLKSTIANINVDMVGRVDKKYADNPNYIYVIGADRLSTELHEINETANKNSMQLTLDYTYNDEKDPNRYYYRSDHYNFAKKGIPAIFYFNGTHDDYHMITDTVEKINFEKMEKVGRLVFTTAWELANRDKRIEVDVQAKK